MTHGLKRYEAMIESLDLDGVSHCLCKVYLVSKVDALLQQLQELAEKWIKEESDAVREAIKHDDTTFHYLRDGEDCADELRAVIGSKKV